VALCKADGRQRSTAINWLKRVATTAASRRAGSGGSPVRTRWASTG
jgi:hypothetical protein